MLLSLLSVFLKKCVFLNFEVCLYISCESAAPLLNPLAITVLGYGHPTRAMSLRDLRVSSFITMGDIVNGEKKRRGGYNLIYPML